MNVLYSSHLICGQTFDPFDSKIRQLAYKCNPSHEVIMTQYQYPTCVDLTVTRNVDMNILRQPHSSIYILPQISHFPFLTHITWHSCYLRHCAHFCLKRSLFKIYLIKDIPVSSSTKHRKQYWPAPPPRGTIFWDPTAVGCNIFRPPCLPVSCQFHSWTAYRSITHIIFL